MLADYLDIDKSVPPKNYVIKKLFLLKAMSAYKEITDPMNSVYGNVINDVKALNNVSKICKNFVSCLCRAWKCLFSLL